MKTSEFVKRVKELGYEVEDSVDAILVCRNNRIFSRVSKGKINKLDTIWEVDIPHELFHVLINYVSTPVEKRGEVKRYYLYNPVQEAYFNYYVEEDRYDWLDPMHTSSIHTLFTEDEIKEHKFKDIMELLTKVL